MERDRRLDVIRGLLLVVMTNDHIGGPLTALTYEPLGFMSAAEGFFLLSGFVAGMVYTRRLETRPYGAVARGSRSRAWLIYRYHVALLVAALTLVALAPGVVAPWRHHLPELFERTAEGFLLGPLLLFADRFGVLRLYVMFVLLLPLLVRWCRNGRQWHVLAASGLLWLAAQFGLREWLAAATGLDVEIFTFVVWQVPFVAGVILGHRRAVRGHAVPAGEYNRRRLVVAAAVAGVALLTKWVLLADMRVAAADARIPDLLRTLVLPAIERSMMAPGRLVNVAAIVYLTGYVLARLRERPVTFGWLQLLGRHSLQVFAFQVALVQAWWLIEQPTARVLGPLELVVPNLVAVASLTLPALLHQRWQDARAPAPAPAPAVAPARAP